MVPFLLPMEPTEPTEPTEPLHPPTEPLQRPPTQPLQPPTEPLHPPMKNPLPDTSDRPNVRFGRTSSVRFSPNDRTFLQNTELFSRQPFIFLFCLMTHMYAGLSLAFM